MERTSGTLKLVILKQYRFGIFQTCIVLPSNIWQNKTILTKEDIKNSIKQGENAGLLVVLVGALKLGAYRGILPFLTRTTPPLNIISRASISVEGAKIMKDYACKKITALEALDSISRTSVATVFILGFTVEGAVIGTAALGVIPFGGAVVGGIIGGTIGNAAGVKLIQNERLKQFEQSVRELYKITIKNIKREGANTAFVFFVIYYVVYEESSSRYHW